MTPAFITRLFTFAHHGQPTGYGGSEMMRIDLMAVLAALERLAPYDEAERFMVNFEGRLVPHPKGDWVRYTPERGPRP